MGYDSFLCVVLPSRIETTIKQGSLLKAQLYSFWVNETHLSLHLLSLRNSRRS